MVPGSQAFDTPRDDIVITGLGLVTSLGLTPAQTWQAMLDGRSGIGAMPALEQQPSPDKGGSQALDIPDDFHPPAPGCEWPRAARYLRFTIDQAMRSTFDDHRPSPNRIAVIMGTTLHGMRAGGEYLRSGDINHLRSFLAGSILDQALEGLPIDGPRLTTCAACSSGLNSIALGATLIRTGAVDVAICGGYDPVSEYAYAGFDSLRLIASAAAPGGPRPFSADRDGMKVGEGYGIVILERANDAMQRGATIRAYLAGIGETSDAFHLTQPDPQGSGAAQAIRIALEEAGVMPAEIDLISAHGTATPNNDASEYAALAAAFGPALAAIPVVAFKSHLGHTLGGAGAVELVLSVMALLDQRASATANTTTVDPAFAGLNLIRDRPCARRIRSTVNLSLGFGGANACAVLSNRGGRTRQRAHSENIVPVITGIGVVLPGIVGRNAFHQFMMRPNGVAPMINGAIAEESFAHLINARRTRRMSEYAKLTLAAANAACQDAGVRDMPEFLRGCSAILGTTHGASPFCEAYYGQIVREGLDAANPSLFAEGVPNAAAAHLSMMLGIKGGCQTIIGSRCAGLDALILGSIRIVNGNCLRVIVGAAEEHSSVVRAAYEACGQAGPDQEFPTASAAVSLVVESRQSAQARGAKILAAIGGCTWCSSGGFRTVSQLVGNLGNPHRLVCGHGLLAADQFALKELRRRLPSAEISFIGDRIAETFSVGPLAALAAALVQNASRSASSESASPVGVLASEFNGAFSGVLVHLGNQPAVAPSTSETNRSKVDRLVRRD